MVASPTIPSSRFAIAFTPEHYRSDDLIGNLWGCFYKLKRSPRQSPPQRRLWVFGFGVVPRHLSLASAEAGVAEEIRAADRLGRFECAGSPIRRPAMRLSVAKRTRRPTCARSGQRLSPAFDGGPPFAHSPVGPPGNQCFEGSRRDTVTEQFPSIVVRLT